MRCKVHPIFKCSPNLALLLLESASAKCAGFKEVPQDNFRLTPAKITIVILSLYTPVSLSAPSVLKREITAASGACLIPVKLSPSAPAAILADHQIKTAGAHLNEREALAKGMTQIQALYGGIPEFANNVVFTFEERTGYSRYEGLRNGKHQIAMNRCNSKGRGCAANNVAHLMHELGHRVGHASFSGRETFYSAYGRLGGDCQPTT